MYKQNEEIGGGGCATKAAAAAASEASEMAVRLGQSAAVYNCSGGEGQWRRGAVVAQWWWRIDGGGAIGGGLTVVIGLGCDLGFNWRSEVSIRGGGVLIENILDLNVG